ncbi:MAG: DUF3060 domain-containing protein [Mycobacteriaceae bacterium]|nr:DUF3060 domain-containing protein [Mycobacteriaceae bacterium]
MQPQDPDAAAAHYRPQTGLAPPPRRIPASFLLAEALSFRWWYVWTLFMVAVVPIAVWFGYPRAFALAAVLTLVAIYCVQLRSAAKRTALLRWGIVANVVDSNVISEATYYGGTTWYNVFLPVAHGWTVTRRRWSGPNIKTRVTYQVDGYRGELVVKGREYIDGVILADQRQPPHALCVTAFPYDLDRDESGNWTGRLRARLKAGMVGWLFVVAAWLTLAVLAASGLRPDIGGPLTAGAGSVVEVAGNSQQKRVVCDSGSVNVSGITNRVTITGHCAGVTVSGHSNRVTIEDADVISTLGVANVVTYRTGSPRIDNEGISNVVKQR